MKKAQQLKGKKEFDKVFSNGRTWANSLIVLKARPNGLDANRYSIVAGKGLGRAVTRNKVKRRLRAVVGDITASVGWDVILVARKGASGIDYHTIESAVRELFARARLLGEDESTE